MLPPLRKLLRWRFALQHLKCPPRSKLSRNDYDQFWQLLTEMMGNEKTPGVVLGPLGTLGRIAGNDPERVVEQLTRAIDRGLPEAGRSNREPMRS